MTPLSIGLDLSLTGVAAGGWGIVGPYPPPPGFVWAQVTFQSEPVTYHGQPVLILQGA